MQRKSDEQLKQEVLRELRWDTRVYRCDIDVSVAGGVVTLKGAVTSYAKKMAAQDAAHRVAGVLDVANDIEVKAPGERNDTEIARAIRTALEWDVLVPDQKILSSVSAGVVTLEGTVDTLCERNDAERAIRRLAGVRSVINRITVALPKVDREDLLQSIMDALERRADREADRLRVEVSDGTVELFGRVHSWQEKRAVLGSISHAPGVGSVKDHLRIDPYF